MSANPGIEVGKNKFTDLVYAVDTVLFLPDHHDPVGVLSNFSTTAAIFGLQISWAMAQSSPILQSMATTSSRSSRLCGRAVGFSETDLCSAAHLQNVQLHRMRATVTLWTTFSGYGVYH